MMLIMLNWFISVAMLLLWIPTDAVFEIATCGWADGGFFSTCALSQEGIKCWVSDSLFGVGLLKNVLAL